MAPEVQLAVLVHGHRVANREVAKVQRDADRAADGDRGGSAFEERVERSVLVALVVRDDDVSQRGGVDEPADGVPRLVEGPPVPGLDQGGLLVADQEKLVLIGDPGVVSVMRKVSGAIS